MDLTQITRFFDLIDGTNVGAVRERLPLLFENNYIEVLTEGSLRRVVFEAGRLVGLLNILSSDVPSTQAFRDEALAFMR